MIDLKYDDLKFLKNQHSWHALEEIMCARAELILPQIKPKELIRTLEKAKLTISDNSVGAKRGNYRAIAHGTKFNDNSKLAIEVFNNLPAFQDLYCDIYNNLWSSKVKSAPMIFKPHDLELFFTLDFYVFAMDSGVPVDLNWYKDKIHVYLDNIFKYTTPQHFVEHANAIGCLDKIIVLTKKEAEQLAIRDDIDDVRRTITIQDVMGLYIQAVDKSLAGALNRILWGMGTVKPGETIILLCPENMKDMMDHLKISKPSLEEMVDKVFSHEIGHLAFAFYLQEFGKFDGAWDIAEKQANWISSIAHDGMIDDLIEEVCSIQPPKYHNPRLLKHVRGLYIR